MLQNDERKNTSNVNDSFLLKKDTTILQHNNNDNRHHHSVKNPSPEPKRFVSGKQPPFQYQKTQRVTDMGEFGMIGHEHGTGRYSSSMRNMVEGDVNDDGGVNVIASAHQKQFFCVTEAMPDGPDTSRPLITSTN